MEEYKQIFTSNGYTHDEDNKRFMKTHRVKRNEIIINGQRSEMFEEMSIAFDYSDDLMCSFENETPFRGFKLIITRGNQSFEQETVYAPVNEIYTTLKGYENMIFGT